MTKQNMAFNKCIGEYKVLVNRTHQAPFADEVIIGHQRGENWYEYGSCKKKDVVKIIGNYDDTNRCFYELIGDNIPVRGYWDIDMKIDKFKLEEVLPAIKEIIDEIRVEMLSVYGHLPDLTIFTSSAVGVLDAKYSYHIITQDWHFTSKDELRAFTERVVNSLKDGEQDLLANTIDMCVYNSNRLFRMKDCNKYKSDRIKVIDKELTKRAEKISYVDTLITNTTGTHALKNTLVNPEKITKKNNNCIASEYLANMLTDVAKAYYKQKGLEWHHMPRKFHGNRLYYYRRVTKECLLCDEGHTRDNTMNIEYMHRGEVYLHCTRDDEKRILIGKINAETKKAIKRQSFMERINKISINDPTKFDQLPANRKNIYNDDKMHEYENVETLCVKAPMGLGKTVQLIEDIKKYDYKYIILISFRKTFTLEAKRRFEGFTAYDEVVGHIDIKKYPRLIIQIESLHRIFAPCLRTVDGKMLVILDESESNIAQFNHVTKTGDDRLSFSAFRELLCRADKVIAMDANMSDRTYNVLEKYRKNSIYYHCNEYKNKTDHICYVTGSKLAWTDKLMNDILIHRVVIISNSCEFAETLNEMIQKKFKTTTIHSAIGDFAYEPRVLLMTGKMLTDQRQAIFRSVNDSWKDYDVIIYTPTVTAGISFEVEHFDKLYGYFSDESCDGLTCDQMLGRVRNLNKKEYNICISARRKYLPDTPEDIKKYLTDVREETMQMARDMCGIDISLDDVGKYIVRFDEYAELWMENTAVKNKFKNKFAEKFMQIIKRKGCTIEELVQADKVITKKELDSNKKDVKEKEAELISSNMPAMNNQTGEIYELEQLVTKEQRAGYRRHQLTQIYNVRLDQITKDFVLKYDSTEMIYMYKMWEISCKGLNVLLKTRVQNIMDKLDTQNELRGGTMSNLEKVILAIKLLMSAGYSGVNDKTKLSKIQVMENLEKNKDMYTSDKIRKYNSIFSIQVGRLNTNGAGKTLKQYLGILNGVLKKLYGIEVGIVENTRCKDEETGRMKRDLLEIKRNTLLDELVNMRPVVVNNDDNDIFMVPE